MSALAWFLTVGATYRLTLLVVADEITDPARDRLFDRLDPLGVAFDHDEYGSQFARGPRPWLVRMLSCPWCVSMWLAPAVVGSGLAWSPGWGWQLTAGALTASAVTGAAAHYAAP